MSDKIGYQTRLPQLSHELVSAAGMNIAPASFLTKLDQDFAVVPSFLNGILTLPLRQEDGVQDSTPNARISPVCEDAV